MAFEPQSESLFERERDRLVDEISSASPSLHHLTFKLNLIAETGIRRTHDTYERTEPEA